MRSELLPWSIRRVVPFLVGVFLVVHAQGQILTVPPNIPPNPLPGTTFTGVVVGPGGVLEASGLRINPGGGGTGISVTAVNPQTAVVSLTNTIVNIGSSGGVKGIVVNGSGASLTLGAGSSVIAQGGGGGNSGITVTNNGMVFLRDGAFVNMPGGGGSTQVQTASGGVFDMEGGSLTVSNGGGNGIRAGDDTTPGTIRLNGTTINVQGSGGNSAGIWANVAGSSAVMNDVTINLDGPGGGNFGVKATAGARVSMTGGSINMQATGGNDTGVQVIGPDSLATLTGTDVTVAGPFSTGLQLNNSGTALVTAGSIQTTGAGGQAILVNGNGQNNGSFDGTFVLSQNGTGVVARDGMNSTLDFTNGASLTGGNGTALLNQTNNPASVVNLNGAHAATFTGDVDAKGSVGTTNASLADRSILTGGVNINQLSGASGIDPAESLPGGLKKNVNVSIDSSSIWQMTKSSTVGTLDVRDGARVNFVHPAASSPFMTAVLDKLTGTGGAFAMNVDLGPIKGDAMIIQTSSQGQHVLNLANRDPNADLPSNTGLLLVKTSDGGAGFSGRTDGGTFKYFVVHGDGSSATPKTTDWYLVRGDQISPPQVKPPTDPGPGQPPAVDPGPVPPGPGAPSPGGVRLPPARPMTRAEALTNPANAAIGTASAPFTLFYADMIAISDRLLELRIPHEEELPSLTKDEKEIAPPAPASPSWAIWVRGFGSGSRIDTKESRRFDQDLGGVQIGADKRFGSLLGGDCYLGIFFDYYYASRDFRDGGDGNSNAFSAGLYGAFTHPNGWYLNLVFKHTYLWHEFDSAADEPFGAAAHADFSVPTFGGSLELGKRWTFGKLFIEPQAELAGGWADENDYTVSNGLKVQEKDQSSLRGRLGIRFGMHLESRGRSVFEPYVKASVVNEFYGRSEIITGTIESNPSLSGASVEAAAGVSARLGRSLQLYGEYRYFNGDKVSSPWAVNGGLRLLW